MRNGVGAEEEKKTLPSCQEFKGKVVEKLQPEIEVDCRFKDLADAAMEILKEMQEKGYSVTNSNCQNFCRDFLKKVGAKSYMTTPEILHRVPGMRFVSTAILCTWTFLNGSPSAAIL